MENQFENHYLVMHNDHTGCFKSLAFLKENNIWHSILQYNSTLFAEFVLQSVQGFEKVSILLTYRGNNFNVQDFTGQITHLIKFYKPDLVLVDFNINALRDSPLLDTMRQRQYGYTLWGTEPTHIMGGLLDQAYIRNNANFFGKVTLQIPPVFYSDHDDVILNWSI